MVKRKLKKSADKTDKDSLKTVKSSLSDEYGDEKALAMMHTHIFDIKEYIKETFRKEITDIDVFNISIHLVHGIILAESDPEKEIILSDVNEIINDKFKLNEFIFTHLAMIKAWNETTAILKDKNDVSENEFNELMTANNEKWQYKAWNDERKVLDIIHAEKENAKGGA